MGKITVSHYLNKRLKPRTINGLDIYPVYIRVTYGRKNHKIKSVWIVHELSDFEFSNDLKISKLKDYESKLILNILANGTNIENINISSRLINTQNQVSECFMGWTIDPKEIEHGLKLYVSIKTGLSIEIFEMYLKSKELYYKYYIELANAKIYSEKMTKNIIYFALLLNFESIFFPDNQPEFTPGQICNFYEWEELKAKQRFLEFAKNENLLTNEELINITEIFDSHLVEWSNFDLRG